MIRHFTGSKFSLAMTDCATPQTGRYKESPTGRPAFGTDRSRGTTTKATTGPGMPTAKHHGTEQDRDIYIGKLQAGGSKYDPKATENSLKHIDKNEAIRKRLLKKLQDRRIQQVQDE